MISDSLSDSLHPYRQFLVAFSGGLDSTVLLHQLVCLRESCPDLAIRAVHVHHGLSVNADAWAEHCREVCERWGVAFSVTRVTLHDDGRGTEAQARSARYRAFAGQLLSDEALLTAQHEDDQCETFMLALKRGSGPAGLAAMPVRLPFAHSVLIRPLLNVSRYALEQYARQHQLRWIEDESNQSSAFDRNFLRLEVLPVIKQRWPRFASMVARSASLCGEQEQLLDELLAAELATLIDERGTLQIAPLVDMSEVRRAALLRRWIARQGAEMPSRAALARVWHEVALSREDAVPKQVFGGYAIRRYQGALWWVKEEEQACGVTPWPAPWAPLKLAGGTLYRRAGKAIRAPGSDEPVTIRYQAAGVLHIVGRSRGRSLKKLWQELGIPPWERGRIPLLFYGERLIAAPGVFVTRDGEASGDNGWSVAWQLDADK